MQLTSIYGFPGNGARNRSELDTEVLTQNNGIETFFCGACGQIRSTTDCSVQPTCTLQPVNRMLIHFINALFSTLETVLIYDHSEISGELLDNGVRRFPECSPMIARWNMVSKDTSSVHAIIGQINNFGQIDETLLQSAKELLVPGGAIVVPLSSKIEDVNFKERFNWTILKQCHKYGFHDAVVHCPDSISLGYTLGVSGLFCAVC